VSVCLSVSVHVSVCACVCVCVATSFKMNKLYVLQTNKTFLGPTQQA